MTLCATQNRITDRDGLLGQLVHQSDGMQCRAWLIINGPYTEPTQGKQAWRLMEMDDDGKPTGNVAQMYADSIYLFHVPQQEDE